MLTTPRFELSYPDLNDAPDGPALFGDLAGDVEGWLARAWPCTSTTRPTGVGEGFLIRERDTSAVLVYDGAGEWLPITSSTGDGSAPPTGTSEHAQYTGSAQSVPSGANTVCAWPTEDDPSPAVTRSTSGVGHQFTLQPGLWVMTATVRWKAASATGERYAGIHLPGASGGTALGGEGGDVPSGRPVTVNVCVTKAFTAPTAIIVNLWQGTGGTRQLEPDSGGWVRLNLSRIGA